MYFFLYSAVCPFLVTSLIGVRMRVKGGGASLTALGRTVLGKYRSLSRSVERTFSPLVRKGRQTR